jgi:membrane-associated phospholipid phosphatase
MLALILALTLAVSLAQDPAAAQPAPSAPAAAAPAPDAAPAKTERKSKRKSKKKSKKSKKTKTSSKKRKKSKKQIAKERDAELGRAWLAAHGVPPTLPTVPAPAPVIVPKPEIVEPMPAMRQATTEALVEAKVPAAPPVAVAEPAKFVAPAPSVGRAPRQSLSVGYTPGEGSLYKLSPAGDFALITAGVLGTVLPYYYADRYVTRTGVGDPNSLNWLDRKALGYSLNSNLATASNITTAAAVGLPMLLDLADLGPSSTIVEDAVVMTEVVSITTGLATAARYGLQRRTPLLYGPQGPANAADVQQYKSFCSMQTAVAFAALSATAFTLSHRYDQNVWPWFMTAAVGGGVAAERVLAGRAFYTDVIAGAAVGVLTGTLIPWLHLRTGITGAVVPTDRGGVQISGGKSF